MMRTWVKRDWKAAVRRISVAALLALGVFTTCYRITTPAMWLDEIYHRAIGFKPVPEIVQAEFFMQFCVGYYLINYWTEVLAGGPELGVRLPQAIAAVFSLLFVYLLGRHMYSTGAGLVAMGWLAISPIFIRYAQENRFYQMGSFAALMTYYFFVRYVETRRGSFLAGLIVGSLLLMHTYTYGFVFVGMLAPLGVLLLVAQWISGRENAPYTLERGIVKGVLIWIAVLVLAWAPLGVRVVSWVASGDMVGVSGAKQGKATFDSWWREPFGVTPQALLAFVQNSFVVNTHVNTHAWRYGALLAAGVIGALVMRRGRMVMCVVYFYLVTLGLVHVSNMTKSVVMAKRFLYIYPLCVLLASGGLATVVEGIVRGVVWGLQLVQKRVRCLASAREHARVVWCVRALVWLLMLRWLVAGAAGELLYKTVQYYYTERAPYKTLAHVLTRHHRPGEPIFWHPAFNDGWLMHAYMNDGAMASRIDVDAWALQQAQVQKAVAQHGGAWLHEIPAVQAGIPAAWCVQVPVQNRNLWLVRAAYSNDAALRADDEEACLRTVVEQARNPELRAAEHLTQRLLQRGATNAADTVAENVARFRWSQKVAEWILNYASNRGDRAWGYAHWYQFAERVFWMPEYQARAVEYALQEGAHARARAFARRYGWWSGDRARAAQWIAQSFEAEHNYAAADAWLARAARRTRSAYHREELHRLRQRWQRERYFEPTLDAWCDVWTQTLAVAMLDDWYELLNDARANTGLWERLIRYTAARGMAVPLLPPHHMKASATAMPVPPHVAASTAGVCAATWPVYSYLIDYGASTPHTAVALIGWRDLPAHGMPGPADMSDAALLHFEQWYRGRLAAEEMAAFYLAAAARSPARAAWAVQRLRGMGLTNSIIPGLRALEAYTDPALARLCTLLRRWRDEGSVQELPEILCEMESALMATSTHLHAQILIEHELGHAALRYPAPASLRALRASVTRVSWPVYVLALRHVSRDARHAELCVPPGQLEQMGFPPVHAMSAATLLWFDAWYERYGSERERAEWYHYIITNAPSKRAWAQARGMHLDGFNSSPVSPTNIQP